MIIHSLLQNNCAGEVILRIATIVGITDNWTTSNRYKNVDLFMRQLEL